MSRLIDADKIDFNEVFKGQSEFAKDTRDAAQMLIDNQPTVEAKPVIHGEWERILYSFVGGYRCSCCGWKSLEKHLNFCPDCGADMRKRCDR